MTGADERTAKKEGDEAAARMHGSCLAELYKALKALGFYPDEHPRREENLRNAWRLMANILCGKELVLSVGRTGFSPTEGGAPVDGNPMAQALARELFIRRVRRLTILPDVSLNDLRAFLALLTVDHRDIPASGGMEALMEQRGITTIWANEIDLSTILRKREAAETSDSSPPPPGIHATEDFESAPVNLEHGSEAGASAWESFAEATEPLTAPDEVSTMGVDEITTRMEREPDDGRYMELAKELVRKCNELKEHERFDEVLPALEALLKHSTDKGKSFTKRGYALFTFEQAAGGRMTDFLVRRLEENDPDDRESVLAIIGQLGPQAAAPLIERLCVAETHLARKALAAALVSLGEDAVLLLVEKLRDERWYVVRNVAAILGEIRYRGCTGELKECIHHPDDRVRKETIRSLVRIGGEEAEAALVELLSDGDQAVRRQAVISLGMMKSRLAVRPLQDIVEAGDILLGSLPLKKEAVQALGRIGDRQATPCLVRLLESRRWLARSRWEELRISAAVALGHLGDPAAMETLRAGASKPGRFGASCTEAVAAIQRMMEQNNA